MVENVSSTLSHKMCVERGQKEININNNTTTITLYKITHAIRNCSDSSWRWGIVVIFFSQESYESIIRLAETDATWNTWIFLVQLMILLCYYIFKVSLSFPFTSVSISLFLSLCICVCRWCMWFWNKYSHILDISHYELVFGHPIYWDNDLFIIANIGRCVFALLFVCICMCVMCVQPSRSCIVSWRDTFKIGLKSISVLFV